MRIIAGTAGRRAIKVPKSVVRPTTDRTREAIFSLLFQVVPDATCLDLFAGSGSLGLEALSRGAKSCVFIDADRVSVRAIEENLRELSLLGGKVHQGDALKLNAIEDSSMDMVFLDPPYVKKTGDRDFVEELLNSELERVVKKGGYVVAEAPAGRVATASSCWKNVATRNYGSCGIAVYQRV